jgi:non-ribosomal peptide synthetase component F
MTAVSSSKTSDVPMDRGGPVDRPFEPFPSSAVEGSIVARFEATARRFSARIALSDMARRLTYAELATLVERIAAATAAAVSGRAGPVAILLPRDVHFPAAMLAVLASGRGFVPLDPGNPEERNRLIAIQSGAAAVISAGDLAERARKLFPPDLPTLDIDAIGGLAGRAPLARPAAETLACVVYTSGSTGRPKGAYHDHRNLLHDVMQQTNTLHLDHSDRVALLYSPTVIGAIREIMMALLNGASLHILPPQELQPAGLVREIRDRGITICRLVPVLLRRMARRSDRISGSRACASSGSARNGSIGATSTCSGAIFLHEPFSSSASAPPSAVATSAIGSSTKACGRRAAGCRSDGFCPTPA